MGVPSSDKGEEAKSALNAAQASLLDLADGGGPAAADTPSSAAAAGGSGAAAGGNSSGGLADLMSLGGGAPAAPAQVPAAAVAAAPSPADLLGDLMGGLGGSSPGPAAVAAGPAAAPPPAVAGGLGGLDDLLGGLGGGAPAALAAPAAPAAPSVSLVAHPQISPQEFQQSWAAWSPRAVSFQAELSPSAAASVEANGYRVRGAWPLALLQAGEGRLGRLTETCRLCCPTACFAQLLSADVAIWATLAAVSRLASSLPETPVSVFLLCNRTSRATSGRPTWPTLQRRAKAPLHPTASSSTPRQQAAGRTCWCR